MPLLGCCTVCGRNFWRHKHYKTVDNDAKVCADKSPEIMYCNAHDETFDENVCPSCHEEWEEIEPDDPRIDEEMADRGKQS